MATEAEKNKSAETPAADDQTAVLQNPKVVEALAKIIPEEYSKLFGQELQVAIGQARTQIGRKAAVGAAAQRTGADAPRLVMDHEQCADWLRCALSRLIGQPVMPNERLDADGVITQALTPTTDAAGGYLSPDEFVEEVEKREVEPQIIWPILTKRQTKRRTVIKAEVTSYITVNKGADANVNAAATATEITETVPVFSELEWNAEDSDARMPIKLDLLEESPINVYEELLALCADAFSIEHERQPLAGTGHANKQALGLLDSGAGITTVPISAAPTVANVLDFCAAIPQRYRNRARIVMGGDTLYAVIEELATNVRSAQFLVGKIPEMLESAHVTEGKILGGDFSRYVVYFIRLFQIITSIAAERKTREVVVTEAWTGQPTITDAFRIGTGVEYD